MSFTRTNYWLACLVQIGSCRCGNKMLGQQVFGCGMFTASWRSTTVGLSSQVSRHFWTLFTHIWYYLIHRRASLLTGPVRERAWKTISLLKCDLHMWVVSSTASRRITNVVVWEMKLGNQSHGIINSLCTRRLGFSLIRQCPAAATVCPPNRTEPANVPATTDRK
jgi:hypothetical protein